MRRIVGVAVSGVLLFGIGAAQAERSAKERYIAGVRGSIDERYLDRLLDQVVNYELLCVRICRPDTHTSVGLSWLRAERHLHAEVERFADRLDRLSPPHEVTRLHADWVSAVRGCAEHVKRLEPALQRVDNLDVIDAFQKKVARQTDEGCFERFAEIIPAFNEKGYVFA